MREVPILFSAPMVRAILDGRKTQTRRALKPQPTIDGAHDFIRIGTEVRTGYSLWQSNDSRGKPISVFPDGPGCITSTAKIRWAPGDRLWVRETWKPHSIYAHMKPREVPESHVFYAADNAYAPSNTRWVPSIFMPRWASRITLLVEAVRVEWLQDISEADARAEGIEWNPNLDPFASFQVACHWRVYGTEHTGTNNPAYSYQSLWNHINGPTAWDANPWVSVTTFRRATP